MASRKYGKTMAVTAARGASCQQAGFVSAAAGRVPGDVERDRGAGGGELEMLQPGDREPGALDGGGGVAAEVTAAEQPRPYCGIEYLLHPGETESVGADVLQKAQFPAGPEYPADLSERGVLVGDGAQDEGDHGGVVADVSGGQRAGHAAGNFYGNGGVLGGCRGEGAQPGFGLDGEHSRHGSGVVAEAGASAGADVDDLSGQAGQQVLAVLGDPASFQGTAHRREGPGEDRMTDRGGHHRLLTTLFRLRR